MLAHHGYAPRNVICCTFTIKASREMRERLKGIVGCDRESKLILGTFHSICRRYLVAYGNLIGIPSNFGIADSSDSLSILKRAAKQLKLSIDPKVARTKISHRKARGQRIEDLPQIPQKTVEQQEFVQIYQEYEEQLRTSNLLDYDDLLVRCTDLLKAYPHCVSNVEALLIDEFQDTNIIQFELMKLLASSKKRITIVGDPDQSIYGFRSAEIENLRKMRMHYPGTIVVNLEENYRSSSAVLQLAQNVIEQDSGRPDKKLTATHCYGTLPVLRKVPNPHEEALWIVNEIKRMTAMTGGLLQYSDFAILLRSAFLSLLIEKGLGNSGIPYKMVGGHRFFDRVEVRLVIDYLRTISAPDNNSALLGIINVPSRKIGATTIKELLRVGDENKLSLWATIQKLLSNNLSLDKKLSKPAEQNLRGLIGLINDGRKKMSSTKPEDTPQVLIEYVASTIALKDYLKLKYDEDYEDRWENVQELRTQAMDMIVQQKNAVEEKLPVIEGLEQRELNSSDETLARFLANITLSTEVEASEEETNQQRVTISTIHSAKGLEWPVVFVPAIYEGSIPHSRAEDTDEERRLLYVAMTRAQALLSLSFPVMQSRDMGESILSQFLPPNVHAQLSATGPNFSDKVVSDIASILRRPCPSQDDLTQGLQTLSDKDSASDDIWPADGSHRPREDLLQGKYAPSLAASTRYSSYSFGEIGLKSDDGLVPTSHHPTSNFVGKGQRLISTSSTTMTDSNSFSVSTTSVSFTTANDRLKADELAAAARAPSTLSTGLKAQTKNKKIDLIQGDISRFFGRNSATNISPLSPSVFQSTGRQLSTWRPPLIDLDPSLPETSHVSKTTVVHTDLLSHKLPAKTAPFKRPRAVLEDRGSPNRKRYVFLSSSPARDTDESLSTVVVMDENASTTKATLQTDTTTPVARPAPISGFTRPATTMPHHKYGDVAAG